MKTRIVAFSVLMMILLNGCLVKSLHQFYHEEDVVFEKELLGTWLDEEHSRWVISPYVYTTGFMRPDTTDNSYRVELYEGDSVAPVVFNAHLFEVEGKRYLDFFPLREDRYEGMLDVHLVSTHSLALIDRDAAGRLIINWFDQEWLEELFEENRIKIAHEVVSNNNQLFHAEYILTASTDELQKFIRKYANPVVAGHCTENDNMMCAKLTKQD